MLFAPTQTAALLLQTVARLACGLILTSTLLSSLPASGEDNPAVESRDDAALYQTGKSSFRKRCARCHGAGMVNPGVGVFDLRNFPRDDKPRFVDSVSNGKNAMPSWGAVLTPDDVDALWVYVTTSSP